MDRRAGPIESIISGFFGARRDPPPGSGYYGNTGAYQYGATPQYPSAPMPPGPYAPPPMPPSGQYAPPPMPPSGQYAPPPTMPPSGHPAYDVYYRDMPVSSNGSQDKPPPSYHQNFPPTSGNRIGLSATSPFPGPPEACAPPCIEPDGSYVYFGSALFERSIFPCKIRVRHGARPEPIVSYGGHEHPHPGRYDLLPFAPDQMELVPTSRGRIPHGRRPVDGGYEEGGRKLYHAIGIVNGVRVPGKTGEHLGCCYVGHAGIEHAIYDDYDILCWR
ncbi:hypothetical protein APHAL10511_000600 [Amanita phalloides]|nr:hypothetical protein APHAL10511_000600 [Amanita phalloides]